MQSSETPVTPNALPIILPQKNAVINDAILYVCTHNCYGVEGQSGGCCMVSDRDWIIGPIDDTERFLMDLSEHLDREVMFEEAFIEYQEGKQLFPDRPSWQNPDHYPALRILPEDPRGNPCWLLSAEGTCSVHEIKPRVCQNYCCQHIVDLEELLRIRL
ncbi:MAG: hypothetical protein AAF483_12440 [Planctomycetota bacterium]